MPECPNCGLKNAAGAVKCALCDSPLDGSAGSFNREPARNMMAPRPSESRIVGLVAIVMAVGAALFLVMRSTSDTTALPETSTPEASTPEASPPPSPPAAPEAATPIVSAETAENSRDSGPDRPALDRDAMMRVIRTNQAGVSACFEKQLRINSAMVGDVTVQITVSPDGSVSRVEFNLETVGSPVLLTCLKEAVQAWRFPARPGDEPIQINLPLKFRNSEKVR